jgi:hypothetical protein
MGFVPTLVGGVIGAVVGLGLHLVVESSTGLEAPWFAIIIGLLTGLGVHQANKSLAGQVSYFRGALTAAIALAAIVGGTTLISQITARRQAQAAERVAKETSAAIAKAEDATGDATATNDTAAATTSDPETAPRGRAASAGASTVREVRRATPFNALEFIYIAVGTFIAYEFGRGSGRKTAAAPREHAEPVMMTDPSN